MKPTVATKPNPLTWFIAIAAVALAARIVYLMQARAHDPLFSAPQMDAQYHHRWALAIAAGREFINDAFFRAPLYPYFLGLVYKLVGSGGFAARLVQALLGSASCGLVYLLARRLLARLPDISEPKKLPAEVIARIAGFAWAFYPLAIYFDGELLIASLLVFLVLLAFVLLLRSHDLDRQWYLPGLVFGLAALARPNILAFLALVPVWLFLERRRRAWPRLAMFWAAAAIVILPVTVRNYVVSRQFVPIAWQAGTNFYIGNNPQSDGATAIMPGTRSSWWGGYNDVKRLAEQAEGRPLKGADVDRYWLARGLDFWRHSPGTAIGLTLRKVFLWFSGYEVSNNRDLYFFKRYTLLNPLIINWPFFKFPFGLVLPLALAGVWFVRRAWRRFLPVYLFIGALSASFIVFFVADRFRMPMIPFFIILAVLGIERLLRLRHGRVTPLAIAAGSFLLFNASIAGAGRKADPAQDYFTVAVGLGETGRKPEALTELTRALSYDSATNILAYEASTFMDLGDLTRAEAAARASLRVSPEHTDAYGILGNVLATKGELDSAEVYFEKALRQDPYSLQAWNNLGNIALTRRDLAGARRYYEGALHVNPVFTVALFHLGLVDYYEGNVGQAHARWREVLKLDPTNDRARQALEQLR